jgi:hypothetical protein
MQSVPCRLLITIAISEIAKTSNHAFSAPLWPESTSQNASGAIIWRAVGVKVPPTKGLADSDLKTHKLSTLRANLDHATAMTTA